MTALADITHLISLELGQVIEVFDQEIASDLPFVNRLATQVQGFRGKLLRPQLLLLSARAAGGIKPDHIVLAGVVEMVHMATLVHDDVLDDADLRRRTPTVNAFVGNEAAVLFGDFLISHAYHLCSRLDSTRASRRIAAVTNTVCEGEMLQIANRGNFALAEAEYLEIIRRKTAALTSVCCELGAEFAGAAAKTISSLTAYGEDLGLAFQIVDDLLDLTASRQETGKSVGRDADLGKLTLPLIRYREQAAAADWGRVQSIIAGTSAGKSERVRELLATSDAVESSMETARGFVESALARLEHLPPSDGREALASAAEFVVQRRQ